MLRTGRQRKPQHHGGLDNSGQDRKLKSTVSLDGVPPQVSAAVGGHRCVSDAPMAPDTSEMLNKSSFMDSMNL